MLGIIGVHKNAISHHHVSDPLYRLTRLTQNPSNAGNSETGTGQGNGSNDFPASVSETQFFCHGIAFCDEQAIESEQRQNQIKKQDPFG